MKVKVDVPATNGRKAYSYFREGNESTRPKSSGISKKAAAGLGAIALGGLAIGGLATELVAEKKRKELDEKNENDAKEAAKRVSNLEEEWAKERGKIKAERDEKRRIQEKELDERFAKISQEIADENAAIDALYIKTQDAAPPPLPRLPYNPPAPKVSTGGLTVAASESSKSIGRPVTSSEAKGVAEIVKKAKSLWNEGWDRDYKAKGVSSLKDNEYDVNKVAFKAGQGTRSAAEAVSNFAQSFYSTFVGNNNTVNTSAEEVKEPRIQKKMKGITVRALPQGGKRKAGRPKTKFAPKDFVDPKNKRQESLYSRIDSFVLSLK